MLWYWACCGLVPPKPSSDRRTGRNWEFWARMELGSAGLWDRGWVFWVEPGGGGALVCLLSLWGGPSDRPYKFTAPPSSINSRPALEHPITHCALSNTRPFWQGGLGRGFLGFARFWDKPLSSPFSHTLTRANLSLSLSLCFPELIAGVPRGAQNFGYVSIQWEIKWH